MRVIKVAGQLGVISKVIFCTELAHHGRILIYLTLNSRKIAILDVFEVMCRIKIFFCSYLLIASQFFLSTRHQVDIENSYIGEC